jgi:hypothetical protein
MQRRSRRCATRDEPVDEMRAESYRMRGGVVEAKQRIPSDVTSTSQRDRLASECDASSISWSSTEKCSAMNFRSIVEDKKIRASV